MSEVKYFGRNYGKIIRMLPCCVCCRTDIIHAHHVKTKGAGGTFKDLVPLCWNHHQEFHQRGRKTFDMLYGVKLTEVAECLWRVYGRFESTNSSD